MSEISHNKPWITPEDRARVDAVLASGYLAQGSQVAALEETFVRMHGGGFACALSSGTAALFLALRGLGGGAGDAVAVPTYSCSALLNAVHMLGARPVPVDVQADNFTIDPAAVDRSASAATIVVAVHCFGASAPVADLRGAGRRVVEDCCQSLGGPQGGDGDASIYSFYATKIVTGGQGGLVWDRSGEVAQSARDYREFDGRRDYVPRFNLQTTDVSAALVLAQLQRLDAIRQRRHTVRAAYLEAAAELFSRGWRVQTGLDQAHYMPHRFVLLAPDATGRERLRNHLAAEGIRAIVPVERFELLHRYLGLAAEEFPIAERLVDTAVSVPLYPALRDNEISTVCAALRTFT